MTSNLEWIQGIWKKNLSSKYLSSWKLRSKLHLVSAFTHHFWLIGFEDLILIFCIWVPNLTIKVIMKNYIFKKYSAIIYRRLTEKIMVFLYWNTFLVHFTMLANMFSVVISDHHFNKGDNKLKKVAVGTGPSGPIKGCGLRRLCMWRHHPLLLIWIVTLVFMQYLDSCNICLVTTLT
jgi:hypothetical protein